jgi:hypothetical protein
MHYSVIGLFVTGVACCAGQTTTSQDASSSTGTMPAPTSCHWTAQDGSEVDCPVSAGEMCKAPAGPNWCNKCACTDPVKNYLSCSGKACGPPPILCHTKGPVFFGGGCTFTYDMCADGIVYQVNCGGPGLTCDCRTVENGMIKDGKQTMLNLCTTPTDAQDNTINTICGWNILRKP